MKRAERIKERAARVRASFMHAFSRENLKALFTQRSFTAGGYTALACLLAIAIAAAAVVGVGALPAEKTQLDISEAQTTSLSDSTKELLAGLEEDITVYLVAEEGAEDEYLSVLLDKYDGASDRLSVVQRDPVLYPAFISQYTSEELSDNSLIVTCGDDFRIVAYDDIYTLDSSSYSYDFAGESALTSAITALVSDNLPTVYTLIGHGELELPTDFASQVETANIDVEELNLLSEGSVPEDADAVIMYAPSSDLSAEESAALLDYLEGGGSFLLMTDYEDAGFENLSQVMDSYGLAATEGLVIEGSSGYSLNGYPYYLLPEIGTHETTEGLSGQSSFVLAPLAHGIKEIEAYRSSLTITPLLETSESAYVKTDPGSMETLSQEDNDVAGQTMIGAAVEESISEDAEARIVWLSSTSLLDSQVDARVGGSNTQFVLSSLSWLCDAEDLGSSISGKSLSTSMLTVDASAASMLSVFLVGIVPLFFLAVGFVIWRSRRRR